MMPLSAPEAQVIKLISTPKLPESLFQNAQPVTVKVLASEGNQASILLAGRQLATQTNVPLNPGQTLSAQPMLVNGQLQLKILTPPPAPAGPQSPTSTGSSHVTTPVNLPTITQDAANAKTASTPNSAANALPNWTQSLPNTTKETLAALKNSLPNQSPLQQLLTMVNDQIQQANQGQKSLNPAWQSLLNQALNLQTPVTAEKVQQSMQAFNDKYANQSTAEWKQGLVNLINNPDANAEEKIIAQQLLNRSELTQQLQNLQHNTGNAVWLQEIPFQDQKLLDNFTLEIDLPKTEQPENEQHWKIFVQLNLPEGDFTSRIQMDKELNLRVQLWGSNAELTQLIQQQAQTLKQALTDQGLVVESLVIVQGKPEPRTEKPLWHQPLVDCHG
ncbi:MAG: flagellar hook-length control protein FliK [Gammaproteobacteria bacterium]|nr:flagellar hook-length control protein FliK [Gammaproteobacteria bacterium]